MTKQLSERLGSTEGLKEGMLVVDASGSMSGYRMFLAILTTYAFAQKYKDTGLNLGLLVFTSNPALIVDPNNTDVDKAVLNVLRLRASERLHTQRL
ncbi:MAG: hypothetical protein DRJ40_10925 [Thermoprotei archaeon]|nr:MAG: hypothetical protein DRJ40_10925 [Thermoprotei archaeon]